MGTRPWNDWYHVMCHTYGTWLPGDPGGFRTRHHRQHIVGDYKHPPPQGMYDGWHRHAKSLMTGPPVYLTVEQRIRAVHHVSQSLRKHEIELVILAIDRVHLHLLARFPDHNPRHWLGLAKKESSAYMKRESLAPPGGLWAVRCKCEPIKDRGHQVNTVRYLVNHARRGAALWRSDRFVGCVQRTV